jgi:dTDP-glucose pyrophosphorylase
LKTLILTAGKIDYTRLPFGMHQSNATIPVNGKPVISWILDDLIRKEISEIYLVLRSENLRLKQLLEKHYSKRITLHLVEVQNPSSILESLEAGLLATGPGKGHVQVILGDTLIYDSYQQLEDTLYVSPVQNTENWCIAQTDINGSLTGFIDKKELPGGHHLALCGYYCFSNREELLKAASASIKDGARELSHVLFAYNKVSPLKLKPAETWFDFGHLESLIQSKKSLLRPRHFNQLTIHPLLNTITKVSEKSDKLSDELNWYKALPEELKILTPRIIGENAENDKITITQEFYGYPSLSELYIYGDLHSSVWESIIDYLFRIHQLFKPFSAKLEKKHAHEIYVTKTYERIEQLLAQSPYWKQLWEYETIVINGISYRNARHLLKALEPQMLKLAQSATYTVIHGDYCLSNILYDLNNQIVKLIDPRGSFGEKGIYGDPRYDIAKLRHSIAGLYDYIVSDLFTLSPAGNGFECSIFEDDKNDHLSSYIDQCITANGYSLKEIKLIEGLLFLSMIPYHADYFERQQMMYIRSILLLSSIQ